MKHVSDLYRENGLEPDLDSYTALLAMYGEAGDMESIMKVSSLSSHTCTKSTGSHSKPCNHAARPLLSQHHNSLDCVTAQKESCCNKTTNMKLSLSSTYMY